MDKLRAMHAFVHIADAGSLSAAARVLDMSLPAVVKLLAALETHLQVRLLNRTTRQMSLTEEGKDYLVRCRRILAEVADAEDALAHRETEPRGILTITAPVMLGNMHIAPALTRFVQRYPYIRCNMQCADRIVNLIEEQVDVGIRIDHLADSSLVAQQVGMVRRVVVASPEHVHRHGRPSHPRDLLDALCVRSGRPWIFHDGVRQFQIPITAVLDFDQAPPAIDACLAGMGYGMFLSYQVAPHLASNALCTVLEAYETPLPVSIVYPQARLLPLRTRCFIEWMKEEFKTVF